MGEIRYIEELNQIRGEIKTTESTVLFFINKSETKLKIKFKFSENTLLNNRINKIVHKSAFCVQCKACQVECPVGAISFIPNIRINSKLCIHCLKCISFTDKGCLRAKSINVTEGGSRMSNYRIATSKYQTFG